MRWFPFFVLAYLFVAVQFSLGGVLGWGEVTPDLVLLLVIFIGMHASMEPALIAAFMLGLMHDVIASHGMGTYALGYTIIAAFAVQLRGIMYSDHLVTHVMMPLMLGSVLLIYLLVRQSVRNFYFVPEYNISLRPRLMSVLITTALAVPIITTLRRFRRSFAFEKRG